MKRRINSVVLPLIGVNVLFFILQVTLGEGFTEALMLVPEDIITRPWIILTSMFLHGGFNHIFFNMYGLLLFGPLLEQRIGPKRFFFIYMLSGIAAAIGHSMLSNNPALGASGAIMGMLGTLIILMPNLRLLFFFMIPMSLRTAGIIWIMIDIMGIFIPTGIGNIAHLVGMGCGLLYGHLLTKKRKKFNKKFTKKSYLTEDDVEEYLKTGRI